MTKAILDRVSYHAVYDSSAVEDFCIEVRPREKAAESLVALVEIVRAIDSKH